MRLHANARTCPRSRRLLVDRVESGWSFAAVAAAAGVSERTVATGRITRPGHRAFGRSSQQGWQRRAFRGGWEYLHVCVDDATRLA